MPDASDVKKLLEYKIFLDNAYRIIIMFALEAEGCMRFSEVSNFLEATAGNTACHLKTLEQAGIICSSKVDSNIDDNLPA